MANQNVTISFVSATGDDDIELVIDLDDEKNKEVNNGRTSSFRFGDQAYFRVFTNPITGVALSVVNSDGVLGSHGGGVADIEQTLTFSTMEIEGEEDQVNSASLDKPAQSGFSAQAYGTENVGSVFVNPDDPGEALASQFGVGVYRATYRAAYHSYSVKLNSPPPGWPAGESYPVVVVVTGV